MYEFLGILSFGFRIKSSIVTLVILYKNKHNVITL